MPQFVNMSSDPVQSAIIDIPARSETNILHLAFSRENPCMQMTKLKIVFFSLLVSGTCWLALAPLVSELLSWVFQALLVELASLSSSPHPLSPGPDSFFLAV